MSNWIWFGLVWLALLGGFIAGAAWTGYMKSFAARQHIERDVSIRDTDDRFDMDQGWPPGEVR